MNYNVIFEIKELQEDTVRNGHIIDVESIDDCENYTYFANRRRHNYSDIKLNFLD